MPQAAFLLLVATVLPLVSFGVLLFIGKRLGRPLSGYVASGAIFLSFVCSISAMIPWVMGGQYEQGGAGGVELKYGYGVSPINITYDWVPALYERNDEQNDEQKKAGPSVTRFLQLGVYVDSLTMVMFAMITAVSTLVHVFSLGYMAADSRYPRFFTYLSLFCFSMLGLVLGGTLLQLFVFWELVGLCSYLLIGFWYEKRSASNAAIKAFVTNRVGDFGFLIGLGILFYHLGNVTLPEVWAALDVSQLAAGGGSIILKNGAVIGATLMTVMGIGLFFGAVGKSAQFPLHVWLPDAMEGPTPVSALIHAATMVAAGVYLVARIFPILTAEARLFIAIIGCITLTMAALIAMVQSDIKKVLAFSTLSQLGYMILAMGIGSWVGALFHLITHAFFKALLFLGSGSVIHAAHHEQEMPQYGGLMRKIPITAATFAVAVLAIAGFPFMAGYWSKDLILVHAGAFAHMAHHHSAWYELLFWVPACMAVVTAFYMTRCWMLTFWGKPRNEHLHEHAHESALLWGPLVPLALLSVIGGFIAVRPMLEHAMQEGTALVKPMVAPERKAGFNLYSQAWESPTGETPVPATPKVEEAGKEEQHAATPVGQAIHHGHVLVERFVFWAFLIGIGGGFAMYRNGYSIANRLTRIRPLRAVHTWLYHRMYFDELYWGVLVIVVLAISKLCKWIDQVIVDGVVNGAAVAVRHISSLAGLNDQYVVDGAVNGLANATQGLGAAVRAPQSGRIRLYVTLLLSMIALGIVVVMVMALSS